MKIRIITASAGSGKTTRLTRELDDAIATGRARADGIIATTFTRHAAAELIERARTRLLQGGRGREAHQLLTARIGTINAVCGGIVSDFAFELGLSPELRVLDEATAELEFRRAIARVVSSDLADELGRLTRGFEREFEWRHEVRRIIEGARANGLTAAELPASAERSIADLDACMGAVDHASALDRELVDALTLAITAIASNGDITKGTATYVETLHASQRDLKGGRLAWGGWAKLTSDKPTKRSEAQAAVVQRAASRHVAHPRLRSEMHQLIRILFRIAADGLTAYQDYKHERGVLDFTDQETLALAAVRRPDVRAALTGQIDLVLVDEFQDTSPIQLALFLELAALATESAWVGDPKQAIYGFRGTDPGLMDAAIESLTSTRTDADLVDQAARAVTQGQVETLDISYRSRPELVAITSDIFASAFASQGMPAERTRLRPAHGTEPAGLGSILEYWPLDAKNVDGRAAAVAAGVRDLLARDLQVRDRDTARAAAPADVAVLCRTNAQCQAVADALADLGVAAIVPRMRLLDTLEAMVLVAALRLWVDPADALAAAELARLVSHPEAIDPFVALALANPGADAFRDDLLVARVRDARADARDRDPLAALDAVIEATRVRDLAASWGDTAQRLANLDALRRHAAAYVDESRASGDAGTLVGLLRRLDEIADDSRWDKVRADSQALRSGEAAVTISTWHAAKGLEWPVTVLFGLESLREPHAHGVHVMTDRAAFEVADPLGGRWIRFWPNPYTNTQQKGPVREAYERSSAFASLVDRAKREALRVLYVGWTRARDRLVLTAQRGKLLEGILGTLADVDPALVVEPRGARIGTEHLAWAGRPVAIDTIPAAPAPPIASLRIAGLVAVAREPRPRVPARSSPSSMPAGPCTIGEVVTLGSPIALRGSPDMEAVGHAVHGFLAADRPGLLAEDRDSMASDLLERFAVAGSLAAREVIEVADRFHAWLAERFPAARLHREYPVIHRTTSGTVVAGTADLVVRSGDQAIVIDHKSFRDEGAAALAKAQAYAGQLAAYSNAIVAAAPGAEVSTWIHCPIAGLAIEVTPALR